MNQYQWLACSYLSNQCLHNEVMEAVLDGSELTHHEGDGVEDVDVCCDVYCGCALYCRVREMQWKQVCCQVLGGQVHHGL